MRDAAAVILAEVIGKALSKLLVGVRKDVELNIALQLAGNQLHKAGLMAILEAIEKVNGVRVLRLSVERNRLDGFAAAALAAWCCRQTRGPPDELYLSNNKICDAGMLKLLRAIGRDRRRRIAAKKPCRKHPIWLELRGNRVCQPHDLLDALSTDVPVCLAIDRESCSLSKCTSHTCSAEELGHNLPSMHLPDFEDQGSAENIEKESDALKCPGREHTPPSASSKHLKTSKLPKEVCPLSQGVTKALSPTSAAYARAEVTLKSKLAMDEAVEEAQLQRIHSTRPRRYVDANGCLHVERGRISERSEGDSAPARISLQPSQEAASEKRSWAATLGKRAQPEQPSFEFMHKDHAPPSFGLWDVANRDPGKRTKRSRNIGKELLKDLGVVESAASSSTKTGGKQSPVGACAPSAPPAAALIRRLSGPVPETPNPTCHPICEPLVSFYVDNSEFLAQTPGLDYRYSKDVGNRYPPGNWAHWGSTVRGSLQGDWLRTGDQRYLPLALNGKTVLRGPLVAAWATQPTVSTQLPPSRLSEPDPRAPEPPISRFAPRRQISTDMGRAEPTDTGLEHLAADAGLEPVAASGGDSDPGVNAMKQANQPPEDIEALKEFVNQRLRREKRFTRTLFSGLDEDRLRTRWRCLRDQLANLAHGKYLQVVACAADSWASYLETSNGRARIGDWLQKKLEEAALKREVAQNSSVP